MPGQRYLLFFNVVGCVSSNNDDDDRDDSDDDDDDDDDIDDNDDGDRVCVTVIIEVMSHTKTKL